MTPIQISNDRKDQIRTFKVKMEQNKYPNVHDY